MDPDLLKAAEAARGFMPPDEGLALYEAAAAVAVPGPLLEVGSYCGKSTVYLGAAARELGRLVFGVDHHRGSEENQPGWEWHEPDLVDPEVGKMDTLPFFRRTVHDAGLEGTVVAVVGESPTVARAWTTPLAFLFVDGGHGVEPARLDYELWTPHVAPGGTLAIHDVFPDPADGGRPPYEEIYLPALASGRFTEVRAVGSLRVLRRVDRDDAGSDDADEVDDAAGGAGPTGKQLSFVTLGARDVPALRRFYGAWGWVEQPGSDDGWAAVDAGAAPVAEPQAREWGGRSGYVADPEGNRWEIAWAPNLDPAYLSG